ELSISVPGPDPGTKTGRINLDDQRFDRSEFRSVPLIQEQCIEDLVSADCKVKYLPSAKSHHPFHFGGQECASSSRRSHDDDARPHAVRNDLTFLIVKHPSVTTGMHTRPNQVGPARHFDERNAGERYNRTTSCVDTSVTGAL